MTTANKRMIEIEKRVKAAILAADAAVPPSTAPPVVAPPNKKNLLQRIFG